MKNKLTEKWVLDQEVGFGTHVAMGGSYLVRKNMGLGLNVGMMATTLSKIETDSDANRGISQVYVNCGYRYYF